MTAEPAGELTCKEFVEVITDYLDGALAPAERERVEAHLAGCSGCRAYLSQMRQTIRVVGALGAQPEAPLGEETEGRLLEIFRAWKGR